MLKENMFLLLLILFAALGQGSRNLPTYEDEFDFLDDYLELTEYIEGDVNILISAPHGGSLDVSGAEKRVKDECSCKPGLGTDTRTKEVLEEVYDAIADLTNKKVWTVATRMHRDYVDLNRASTSWEDQGCCGVETDHSLHPDVEASYNEFHDQISAWKDQVNDGAVGLMIELHGQAHPEEWLEVGFGMLKNDLQAVHEDDYYHDEDNFRTFTMRNSAKIYGEVETISGPSSFGSVLQRELENVQFVTYTDDISVEVVPSPEIPFPNDDQSYYAGSTGNIHRYAGQLDSPIDAIQLETPRWMRGYWEKRVEVCGDAIDCCSGHEDETSCEAEGLDEHCIWDDKKEKCKFPASWSYENDADVEVSIENRKRYAQAVAKAIVDYATQIGILEEDYYVSLTGQCLEESHRITDPDIDVATEACQKAAEKLGLKDQTPQEGTSSSVPLGCYQKQDNAKGLWINQIGQTDVTSTERRAICDYQHSSSCRGEPDIENVKRDLVWSKATPYGESVAYSCQENFYRGIESQVTCGPRGNWIINDNHSCKGYYLSETSQCEEAEHRIAGPDVEKATEACQTAAEVLGLKFQTAHHGTGVSFPLGCYQIQSSEKLVINNENGNPDLEQTERRSLCDYGLSAPCHGIPDIEHVNAEDGWTEGGTLHGASREYSCEVGYWRGSEKEVTCGSNGNWEDLIEMAYIDLTGHYCEENDKYLYYQSENGICESQYGSMHGGMLQNNQMYPTWIVSKSECEVAYASLGLTGSDGVATVVSSNVMPRGCYIDTTNSNGLQFNEAEDALEDVETSTRIALCRDRLERNQRRRLQMKLPSSGNKGRGRRLQMKLPSSGKGRGSGRRLLKEMKVKDL